MTDDGKDRPKAIGTFGFTTQSQPAADAIAGLYGGTVQPGEDGGFEVLTRKSGPARRRGDGAVIEPATCEHAASRPRCRRDREGRCIMCCAHSHFPIHED